MAMAASLAACGGGGDDAAPAPAQPAATGTPWTTQVTMGNFSINSASITTNQDGVSVDYIDDYVNASALPSGNFQNLTINAYIPVTDAYTIDVTGVNVQMHTTGNLSSGNIYLDTGSSFLQRTTINGRLYSVFRVAASYDGSRGNFTAANFANVVFTLQIRYTNSSDQVVGTRTSNFSVYKR
ncbi:MAG TPA: hypothetical protein VHQ87_06270 [Rhizobacter sp.]|nr:hypothetical protein [Rhizobacter sp.]